VVDEKLVFKVGSAVASDMTVLRPVHSLNLNTLRFCPVPSVTEQRAPRKF
jgi:hypothetical protein